MTDIPPAHERRLADLEARVRELEAVQQLMVRIISTTRPFDRLLEHYGATETQVAAFYRLLDSLVVRVRGREDDRPTYGYFRMQTENIFPALRGDREFIGLLVDTLKVAPPAYRELHAYAIANGWDREATLP